MCDFDMSLACLTWFGLTRQCLCQFGRRNWQCLRKSYISTLVAPLPYCGVGGTGTPPNWAVHCCEPQFSDISKYRVLSFLTGQRIIHIPGDKKHFHSIFFLWGKLVLLSLAEVVFQASSLSNDDSKQNQHFLSKVKSDWIIFD